MLKRITSCCLLLASSLAFAEDSQSPNFSFGVGLNNGNALLLPKNAEATDDLIPQFSMRAALDQDLNADWILSSGLSVEYANSDIKFTQQQSPLVQSNVKNTGIWLDSKLAYKSLADGVRPFVQVAVGKVHGSYQQNDTKHSDWETGYKIVTGLEFDLTEGSSLSIGVGSTNIGSMN